VKKKLSEETVCICKTTHTVFKQSFLGVDAQMQVTASQQAIVDVVKAGKSRTVDAVAGAGKRTTIRHISKAQPSKKFLVLIYNKFLQK